MTIYLLIYDYILISTPLSYLFSHLTFIHIYPSLYSYLYHFLYFYIYHILYPLSILSFLSYTILFIISYTIPHIILFIIPYTILPTILCFTLLFISYLIFSLKYFYNIPFFIIFTRYTIVIIHYINGKLSLSLYGKTRYLVRF